MRVPSFMTRDVLAGLIFLATGALFLAGGSDLALGTTRDMGPGYLPRLLAVGTMLIGAAVMCRSVFREGLPVGRIPWRALVLVTTAITCFGLTVRGLGFLPAVVLASTLASLAEERTSPIRSAALALLLGLFCWLIFLKLLGLPYSMFGPWLRGT
jgi:hypothetical protein